MYVIIELIG